MHITAVSRVSEDENITVLIMGTIMCELHVIYTYIILALEMSVNNWKSFSMAGVLSGRLCCSHCLCSCSVGEHQSYCSLTSLANRSRCPVPGGEWFIKVSEKALAGRHRSLAHTHGSNNGVNCS